MYQNRYTYIRTSLNKKARSVITTTGLDGAIRLSIRIGNRGEIQKTMKGRRRTPWTRIIICWLKMSASATLHVLTKLVFQALSWIEVELLYLLLATYCQYCLGCDFNLSSIYRIQPSASARLNGRFNWLTIKEKILQRQSVSAYQSL
jgi:hypothetical protein